jgi:AcrR family transcriptional regulator
VPAPTRRPPRRTPAELRERMPRRTPAETRELMLQAAVQLLRERAEASGDKVLAAALAHVRLSQVAERATDIVREQTGDEKAKAITTGALYQQWPTQSDFQVDLLFHIAELQSTLVPGLPESLLRFQQANADAVPLETVLSRTMEEVHRHYREDPLYRVELALLIGVHDPRLRAALEHRMTAFYVDADQAWQALLDAYALRIRPPFTVRHLSRAVAAQIGGSVVLWFEDPELLDDPLGGDGPSMMSWAILGIVERLTEPAPPEGPAQDAPAAGRSRSQRRASQPDSATATAE